MQFGQKQKTWRARAKEGEFAKDVSSVFKSLGVSKGSVKHLLYKPGGSEFSLLTAYFKKSWEPIFGGTCLYPSTWEAETDNLCEF